jgi:WD40 repeat protein/class 3 adenylate cyclase
MARGRPRPDERRPGAVHTFLIADIRGFTHFTNRLGDEAVGRLATKFAHVTGEAVEAWGGELLELRGDEALCMFDSPRAALRCAVELQDAYIDETRLDPILPLSTGIGLDAGEAVPVGDGFRGSALNLAARLCSAAEAGEVIATDGIVHLAGRMDGLSYAALGGKSLKGFAEPVDAWLVTAERPHDHLDGIVQPPSSGSLPAELDAIVPLAGREPDLRWLGWHWRRARHGHGSIVAISGPSGMGRTRMAAEVAALAHGQGAAVRYLRADDGADLPAGSALVVIDDLDRVPATRAEALLDGLAPNDDRRLVILTHGDDPPHALARSLDRLVPPERRRRLSPLDADAVAAIARLYFERPDDDPPTQLLLEESDGIPAAVHRVASQWARAAAARRLGESARRTSRERRDLRAAEGEMIDDAARLELARERSRLFVELDEEATAGEAAAPTVTVCPYKGLAAFEAADGDYYFGRERLIAELIARMVGSTFVGLIGASGSGKSSALHAGLLPALASGVVPGSDEWIQVPMRPGEHPMRQLQSALARALPREVDRDASPRRTLDGALEAMAPRQRTLLVIDQFEELFTAVVDEVERTTFIDFISEPRAGLKVLVAVRADHYERCADDPRLARLIGADQVLVGPLAAEEIAAVIRHPAERVGLRVEPELVQALVADVGSEPGALPLLSTALLELWGARDGGRLTLAAYRATGGVRGAVGRLAEAAWARLDEPQQVVARAMFLRLTGSAEGTSAVKRRVTPEELDAARNDTVGEVLGQLTAARLLTASDGYVEVAHEALLREWPRLRGWVEEDAAGRQLRLHLIDAAREWDGGGREDGDLYRGARLASTLDWSAEHQVELNETERTFIQQSRVASQREAERQRRTNRILRGLLAAAAVLLAVAAGAGLYAGAKAREATAQALYAASVVAVDEDPELAMLLALEGAALDVEPPPDAVSALHRAIQDARTLQAVRIDAPLQKPGNIGVALSPAGDTMYLSGGDSGTVHVVDVSSGQIVRTLGESRTDLLASQWNHPVALSPDGGSLAIVDEDALVHIWDLADGSEQRIQAPGLGAGFAVFSPNSRRLAVHTFESDPDLGPPDRSLGLVTVWDLGQSEEIFRRQFESAVDPGVAFDSRGESLLITDCVCNLQSEERVLGFDLASGEQSVVVATLDGIQDTAPRWIDVSPDATLMASGGADRMAVIWDAQTGSRLRTLTGHTDWISGVRFSPDGATLATTSLDGTIRVWDVASGEVRAVLRGQGGSLGLPTFSADGRRLASGSSDLSARVWDISDERSAEIAWHPFGATFGQIRDVDVRGNSVSLLSRTCIAVCLADLVLIDAVSGESRMIADDQAGAAVAIAPDGTSVVSQAGVPLADGDFALGPIRSYSLAGEINYELQGICPFSPNPEPWLEDEDGCEDAPRIPWWEQAWSLASTPDGQLMALVGFSGAVSTWGSEGQLLEVAVLTEEQGFHGLRVAVSPDASRIAVLTTGGGVRVLDSSTLTEVAIMTTIVECCPFSDSNLEFSPDGDLLVVATSADLTRIYETETWALTHELPVRSTDLDFTADGTTLVSADADGFVRVWDVRTAQELHRIAGVGTGWARLLQDERHIVTVDADGLRVMTTDVTELLAIARDRLTRELTAAECAKFGIDPCRNATEPTDGEEP